MTKISDSLTKRRYALLVIASVLGGILNGFLGAAGGILIGLALTRLLTYNGELVCDRRDIYANVQVAMICVSLVSLCIYSSRGALVFSETSYLLIPAVVGGAAGSLILRKMNPSVVGKIFAALVIWSGIRMIVR